MVVNVKSAVSGVFGGAAMNDPAVTRRDVREESERFRFPDSLDDFDDVLARDHNDRNRSIQRTPILPGVP
jgi:hypothetical protein